MYVGKSQISHIRRRSCNTELRGKYGGTVLFKQWGIVKQSAGDLDRALSSRDLRSAFCRPVVSHAGAAAHLM